MNFTRRLSVIVAICLYSSTLLCSNSPGDILAPRVYKSDVEFSSIGKPSPSSVDYLGDNGHTIDIPELPEEFEAYLLYDLKGITNSSGLAKTINGELAMGGFIAQTSDHWITVEERLSRSALRPGRNEVFFSIPSSANYSCELRNVRLMLRAPSDNSDLLFVDPNSLMKFGSSVYLNGLLNDTPQKFEVEGVSVPLWSGKFEFFGEVRDGACTIEIIDADGSTHSIEIASADFVQVASFNNLDFVHLPVSAVDKQVDYMGLHLNRSETSEITVAALREVDIPNPQLDIANVTKSVFGYRISGASPISDSFQMSIEFDSNKLPQGYKEQDVKVFAFDSELRRWVDLGVDSIDFTNQTVSLKTGRFDEFIAGIIKVPESPETASFISTSIKDLELGNVADGISSIPAPQANNMGSASTSFSLKVPTGRGGMQPSLSLNYNSQAGNGRCGVGWSLPVSSISVDTRWGVPRYNGEFNSETYLMDGQMLDNVAHRLGFTEVDRESGQEYHPRVEGDFKKMIRYGSSPSSHYWIVTDKSGVKYYYGGINSVDENAVLTTDDGDIAKWMLVKVENPNGQSMTYSCSVESIDEPDSPSHEGRQIYLDQISYTHHASEDGKYSVEFAYEDGRDDVMINCKKGFKEVTNRRLVGIEMMYDDQTIRHYELEYSAGAFFKTLLDDVVEYDQLGNEFYRYGFNYYGGENGDIFESEFSEFDDEANQLEGNLLIAPNFAIPEEDFNDYSSSLGGTNSKNRTIGGSLVIGLGSNVSNKSLSVGGNFSRTKSESEGLAAMIDINGDSKPDKIEVHSNGVYYRKNISTTTDIVVFSEQAVEIPSFPSGNFSESKTKSTSKGLEATAGAGPFSAFFGKNWTDSESETTVYFIDRNGDGLMDVVADGLVFFNSLNDLGEPTFSAIGNEATENPLGSNADMSDLIFDVDPDAYTENFIEEQPLHDLVKVWTAPFNGEVDVTGVATLINLEIPADSEYTGELDGVFVAIQHNEEDVWNYELTTTTPNHSAITNATIDVKKDDHIYFRVNSKFDGFLDQVEWSPSITYNQTSSPELELNSDVNGNSLISYNSESDFLLMNDQTVYLSQEGVLTIESDFHKFASISEDITVAINVYDTAGVFVETWYEHSLAYDSIFGPDIISYTEIIPQTMIGYEIEFIIESQTNVDWDAFDWNPSMYYDPSFVFQPIVKNNMHNRVHHRQLANQFIAYPPVIQHVEKSDAVGLLDYRLRLQLLNLNFPQEFQFNVFEDEEFNSDITLSVKGTDGTFYGTKTYEYNEDFTTAQLGGDNFLEVTVPNDVDLFLEVYIENARLAELLSAVPMDHPNPQFFRGIRLFDEIVYFDSDGIEQTDDFDSLGDNFAIWTKPRRQENLYGHNFKGWGQFIYRGNEFESDGYPSEIIEQNLTFLDPTEISGSASSIGDPDDLENIDGLDAFDPVTAPMALMCLDKSSESWVAYDTLTYISATEFSSSRLGEDNPVYPGLVDVGVDVFQAPVKRSSSSGTSKTGGISSPLTGANGSVADSGSKSFVDAIDFNGDRYTDYLNDSIIQYTNILGGLESSLTIHDQGLHESTSHISGISVSGSSVVPSNGNSMTCQQMENGTMICVVGGAIAENETQKSKASFSVPMSLNATFNRGESHVESTWMDINGDGLPDRITEDGLVSLNVGYEFLPPQDWGFVDVRKMANKDFSAGLGISLYSGSIQAGVGGSWSENFVIQGFSDLNSDGLQDIVYADTSIVGDDRISGVRFNLGDSFSALTTLNNDNLGRVDQAYSAGESINGAFTVGVSFLFFKVCVNPSVSLGRGFSRQETQLMDINNDGFQDYISTRDNNDLKVLFSKIGKTNLLRSIETPLGAEYTVDYEPTQTTYDYPNPKWVMSSLDIYDGHDNDGEDEMHYAFDYRNGQYDRREREDYGFGEVETQQLFSDDSVYRRHVSTYDNSGYYTNGLVLSEVMYDEDGNKWTEVSNSYELKNIQGDFIPNAETFNQENDYGVAWPALVSTTDIFYEGEVGPSIERLIEFTYDEIGNITSFIDRGDDSNEDDLTALISYHDLGDIVNIPDSIVVLNNGTLMRTRGQSVDGAGNVTQMRQHFEDGLIAFDFEYYDASTPAQGNLKKTYRPENVNEERMFYEYEYDDDVYQFITSTSDAYGYSSSSVYDHAFGVLTSTTDLNGHEISYSLDAKGRVDTVVGPYEQGTGIATVIVEYELDANPPYSVVSHHDPEINGNRIETVTFLDGLSRPIQVQKTGQVGMALTKPLNSSLLEK